jgi:5-hydroxyisourate hydrolase-like protein (transthyretin family)
MRRVLLTVAFAFTLTITGMGTFALPASAAYGFDNTEVANQARSYAIGSYGGQCKPWAANVVNVVLARHGVSVRIGGYESANGAYWGAYVNAGGIHVDAASARPGDLIQLNKATDRYSNTYYTGMHTAIIVANTSIANTFVVRDSNWGFTELVSEHQWNPVGHASKYGLEANFWRFGSVPSTTLATRDLAFVKWAPTGSGRIEVHTATAASGYASFGVHAATPIGAGDTNGVFDMADVNADGRSDLVYIKRRNTGSGRIEVHWVNAATGYSSFGGNIATVFSTADDPNGSFEMADMNGDGRADLVFTKTRNTGSGRIELHWADAASGYARFGANLATAFSLADAGNGYFHPADMNADGRVDLAFVKIRNTGSGRIEVHWANAAAGYGSFGGHYATALSGAERNNGWFETVDMNGDRAADLVFIKDYNVGSGRIELHWLDAGAGFTRVTLSAATAFSAAEAGHGFFTMMA